MAQKRYQVFISSTFSDLENERLAVLKQLMTFNCVPVGMELFPAASDEQFEFIKKLIDESDYYVVIIAGRYGSLAEDGLSYTEKEFDYAVSAKIPILAFLHQNPGEIPSDHTDPKNAAKLKRFRRKVSTKRLVKYWANADDLKAQVQTSLQHAFEEKPRKGWVRSESEKDYKDTTSELAVEIKKLERSLKSLQTKKDKAETQAQKAKDKLGAFQQQIVEQAAAQKAHKDEIKNLLHQQASLGEALQEKNKTIGEMEKAFLAAQQSIEQAEQLSSDLQKAEYEAQSLRNEIVRLTQQQASFEDELQGKAKIIDEVNRTLSAAQKAVDQAKQLSRELQKAEHEAQLLREQNSKLATELQAANEETNECAIQNALLESKVMKRATAEAEMQSTLTETKKALGKAEGELQALRTSFSKTSTELRDAKAKIDILSQQRFSALSTLAQANVGATELSVRKNAIEQLLEFMENREVRELLGTVALNDPEPELRQFALTKIVDQDIIARVAKEDKAPEIRQSAVKRVTSQAVLAWVAINDPNLNVRKNAIEQLLAFMENREVRELLGTVALNDPEPELRHMAVLKIADQKVIAQVAKNDLEPVIRQAATRKLTSQADLAWIAINDPNRQVRSTAAELMNNVQALVEAATKKAGAPEEKTKASASSVPPPDKKQKPPKIPENGGTKPFWLDFSFDDSEAARSALDADVPKSKGEIYFANPTRSYNPPDAIAKAPWDKLFKDYEFIGDLLVKKAP